MQHLKKYLILLLCFTAHSSFAQFCFKAGQIAPKGDIGMYYGKNAVYEAYILLKEDRLRYRFGAFYAKCNTRIDTMPVYAIQNVGGAETFRPGYMVNHDLKFYCISADLGYRLFRIGNFFCYASAGLTVGITHAATEKGYDSVIMETINSDYKVGGYKVCIDAEYKINEHLEVVAGFTRNGITSTDWSTSFSHHLYSIGLNYSINPFDD